VCGTDATTTASLTLDGTTTDVDLCARHAKAMAVATKPYTSVGRTTGHARAAVNKRAAKKSGAKKAGVKKPVAKKATSKKKTTNKSAPRKRTQSSRVAEIRAWGYANGFDVASRGRLRPELVEAFEAASN
jgi:hypothetical protein